MKKLVFSLMLAISLPSLNSFAKESSVTKANVLNWLNSVTGTFSDYNGVTHASRWERGTTVTGDCSHFKISYAIPDYPGAINVSVIDLKTGEDFGDGFGYNHVNFNVKKITDDTLEFERFYEEPGLSPVMLEIQSPTTTYRAHLTFRKDRNGRLISVSEQSTLTQAIKNQRKENRLSFECKIN